MNEATIEAIAHELRHFLVGKSFGRIFQLSSASFAIDFRLPSSLYLFLSVEPNMPRVYLIKRKLRELEKQSITPSNFLLFVRKRLSGAFLEKIEKIENERALKFLFVSGDEFGKTQKYALLAQLTGRSANLFLLDEHDTILFSLRETHGEGQTIGSRYAPPIAPQRIQQDEQVFDKGNFETLSEALDIHYKQLQAEKVFQSKAKSAENFIKKSLAKCETKRRKLLEELKNAEQAPLWKRYGDLILANLHDAVREGNKVLLTDYFDEQMPTIELEIEETLSLTEAAEKFFKRYSKAKRAEEEIKKQLDLLNKQEESLLQLQTKIKEAIEARDEGFLDEILSREVAPAQRQTEDKDQKVLSYARRFVSSDGMEILVGKGSKENDYLTFRIAKSLDFWLHTADYAGSHVIVRNPNRLESLPQKTLLEAASLAAFYSQARKHPKVAVNYTQRKYVHKPKAAPSGLVSLSKFKTILVEPKVELESF